MLDLISKGGPIVWLLLGCFGLAVAVFIERLSYFHRAEMNIGEFLAGLASLIRRKNYAEALQECVATRVPAGRVLHAALLRHHLSREQLKAIVQEAGQLEVPRLERYLSVLHAIAHAAPLIGLLGTVAGLIDIVTELNKVGGFTTPAQLSKDVFQCLVASALGLVVAIPSYLFYAFLAAKSSHIMHDLERAGIEIVNIIEDHRETTTMSEGGAQIVEFRKAEAAGVGAGAGATSGQRGRVR